MRNMELTSTEAKAAPQIITVTDAAGYLGRYHSTLIVDMFSSFSHESKHTPERHLRR